MLAAKVKHIVRYPLFQRGQTEWNSIRETARFSMHQDHSMTLATDVWNVISSADSQRPKGIISIPTRLFLLREVRSGVDEAKIWGGLVNKMSRRVARKFNRTFLSVNPPPTPTIPASTSQTPKTVLAPAPPKSLNIAAKEVTANKTTSLSRSLKRRQLY
jgi:hypothetical protein